MLNFRDSMQERHQAEKTEHQLNDVHDRMSRLEKKVETLVLLNQALLELLCERTGLSEAEVVAKITEVDLRDGVRDGKIGGGKTKCQNCDRPYNHEFNKCLYCGFVSPNGSIITKL